MFKSRRISLVVCVIQKFNFVIPRFRDSLVYVFRAAKFSLGNYCRQVVSKLFNKNQTLHDLILGENAPFPNPWYYASLWGPTDFEHPSSATFVDEYFTAGNCSCDWFLDKYVRPAYGPTITMDDPIIDKIPITIDDYNNYCIVPQILPSQGEQGRFCNEVNTPQDGYDYARLQSWGDPTLRGSTFLPPSGTNISQFNQSLFVTSYWTSGCYMQMNAYDYRVFKTWLQSPCQYWVDEANYYIYLIPCDNNDYRSLTSGQTSPFSIDGIPLIQTLTGSPTLFNTIYYSNSLFHLEIQDLQLHGYINLQHQMNSLHHNYLFLSTLDSSPIEPYWVQVWNNIFWGGFIGVGLGNGRLQGEYLYFINNTCSYTALDFIGDQDLLIRGNTISNAPNAGFSILGRHSSLITTYTVESACNSNYLTTCYYCSYIQSWAQSQNDCDAITLSCTTYLGCPVSFPQATSCTVDFTVQQYCVNCPGPYSIIFEYNNCTLQGLGDVEYQGSQESNPGIIIQRNEFSHEQQGVILDQFCPYATTGYGLTTENNDAPLFLNTYTIIKDNIIVNSSGGSIYSGGGGFIIENNLMISSPPSFYQPGTWAPNVSNFDGNKHYSVYFVDPIAFPQGRFPYCPGHPHNLKIDTIYRHLYISIAHISKCQPARNAFSMVIGNR